MSKNGNKTSNVSIARYVILTITQRDCLFGFSRIDVGYYEPEPQWVRVIVICII